MVDIVDFVTFPLNWTIDSARVWEYINRNDNEFVKYLQACYIAIGIIKLSSLMPNHLKFWLHRILFSIRHVDDQEQELTWNLTKTSSKSIINLRALEWKLCFLFLQKSEHLMIGNVKVKHIQKACWRKWQFQDLHIFSTFSTRWGLSVSKNQGPKFQGRQRYNEFGK